jgi:transcriptional regulator with XRE-family HTH domain
MDNNFPRSSVLNTKRVGQLLKEAREEKSLNIRDVSKEINIPLKYIIALENEDYSQFPAETYTVGFLKTYCDFLKIDSAYILNLYKGEQLEQSQLPLEELTKPTVKMIAIELEKNKAILPIIIVVLIFIAVFLFSYFYDNTPKEDDSNSPNVIEGGNKYIQGVPSDISFISQSIPEGSSGIPFTLTPEQGFTISVNNQQCKIFIKGVRKGEDSENIAIIGFNIFPDKVVFPFETKVGEEYTLSYNTPGLENLRREIKVVTQAITDKSAKVLVSLSSEKSGSNQLPSGNVPIQITLYFNKSSYAEFIIDGQTGEKGLIPSGEVKQLEAKDRLEIIVGDGGAVEMVQNGKDKVVLGKPGKVIKKIFYKAAKKYDSTQFIIKEVGE